MTLTDEQRAKVESLVAEKVMGWTWHEKLLCWYTPGCALSETRSRRDWKPTTSGDAMLEVIEKMRERGYTRFSSTVDDECWAGYRSPAMSVLKVARVPLTTVRETMPLCVALAALSAVGVDWRAELGMKEGV